MAFSRNKIFIAGNLTRDPELKYTPAGTAVCTFGVATSYSKKDPQDETKWVDVTTFHNVVVWGRMAEIVVQNLHKGQFVDIEGRQENRSYEKKDGTKGYMSEVVAHDLIWNNSKKEKDSPEIVVAKEIFKDSEEATKLADEVDAGLKGEVLPETPVPAEIEKVEPVNKEIPF